MYSWFSGPFMMLLFVLITVALIYLIIRLTGPSASNHHNSPDTPLEIVKKRYAKGDISKEEFDEIKRDLES
jgi:putative membrane protein